MSGSAGAHQVGLLALAPPSPQVALAPTGSDGYQRSCASCVYWEPLAQSNGSRSTRSGGGAGRRGAGARAAAASSLLGNRLVPTLRQHRTLEDV